MSAPKRLLVLGATGSIGRQALDVCARSEELELVGLSAERSWEELVEQARATGVQRIALADRDAAARAAEAWTDGQVLGGPEGLVRLVVESGADLVLNALVGSAGLGPTVAALGEGIDLALANKESLVVGGELVTALAEATGARILPVDSEHTALHQLIAGQPPGAIERLTITASGGPFRGRAREQLREVTVEEALAHPTWAMGGKITIDSATLMNKGLEVIEAHHLFGTPTSASTSSCTRSRWSTAWSSSPTARCSPTWARRTCGSRSPMPCTAERASGFRSRRSTWRRSAADLRGGRPRRLPLPAPGTRPQPEAGTAPCVLNAANEIAVHAFLDGRLGFLDIPAVIERRSPGWPASRCGLRVAVRGRPRSAADRRRVGRRADCRERDPGIRQPPGSAGLPH